MFNFKFPQFRRHRGGTSPLWRHRLLQLQSLLQVSEGEGEVILC